MQFLSDEWRLEALGRLRGDSTFTSQASIVGSLRVWIVADPRPRWAESITLVIRDAVIDAVRGEDGTPDGMARASYDTWLRLFRGELSPKRAAMTRKLRGKGLPVLLRNMGLLNALVDVLRSIPLEDPDASMG
ncbi:MAG: SCP2 sterol-binding domain-containing protein [Acidimicrobiia bacterium]